MKILILCGGQGSRLWPLTGEGQTKPFLSYLRTTEGGRESMIQRMVRQIRETIPAPEIYTVAGSVFDRTIREQLGEEIKRIVEPGQKNTFSAVCWGVASLLEEGQKKDETVAVLPADLYTKSDFFEKFQEMNHLLEKHPEGLILMGISGKSPSSQYGYFMKESDSQKVVRFVEKPEIEKARELVREGAKSNSGVFMFRMRAFQNMMKQKGIPDSLKGLTEFYPSFSGKSLDEELLECEAGQATTLLPIYGVDYDGEWEDLGTWKSFCSQVESKGNYVEEKCAGVTVINELGIPMLLLGLSDVIVCGTAGGILIADRNRCEGLKFVPS